MFLQKIQTEEHLLYGLVICVCGLGVVAFVLRCTRSCSTTVYPFLILTLSYFVISKTILLKFQVFEAIFKKLFQHCLLEMYLEKTKR